MRSWVGDANVEGYQQPILDRKGTRRGCVQLSRLLGLSSDEADGFAAEITKDMHHGTHYVTPKVVKPEPAILADAVLEMADRIVVVKREASLAEAAEKANKDQGKGDKDGA